MSDYLRAYESRAPRSVLTRSIVRRPVTAVGPVWHGLVGKRPAGRRRELYPPKGRAVVYVLCDVTGTVVYVGSTADFRPRLTDHVGKRPAYSWAAFACKDREQAYDVELRYFEAFRPNLNKSRPWVNPRHLGAANEGGLSHVRVQQIARGE